MESAPKNQSGKIPLLFSVLVMIVLIAVFNHEMETVKSIILQAGLWGLVISILVYALLGLTLVPSEPLTIMIGGMFGPLIATLIAWIGNTLAGVVEYYLGKNIRSAASFEEQRKNLPLGLGKLPVDSPLFLLGARALPGFGPKFVSVVAGLYNVPMLRYLWTTAAVTLIGAVIFAFGGFGIAQVVK